MLARPARPHGTPATVSRSRRSLVIAAAAGALLGFAAIALADRNSDGDDQANVRSDVGQETTSMLTPAATAAPVVTTATTAPTTTTTTVASIGSLTDLLSAGPEDYGKKGPDLLDKLQEVQRKRGRDQAEKAADLIEEVSDWVEEGELDAGIAAQARELLEPLASRGPDSADKD